jgi:hypothetical protein
MPSMQVEISLWVDTTGLMPLLSRRTWRTMLGKSYLRLSAGRSRPGK